MTHSFPAARRIAATAAAAALALTLTACTAPVVGDADPAPSATRTPPHGVATPSSPAPGRTVEAAPPGPASALRGVRIAVVAPDSGAASLALQQAVRAFAEQYGVVVAEFVASGDAASVDAAFEDARETEPHVVVGLGPGAVDAFAYESAQRLDQEFLLLGAQVAEPTANVTSVVWEGATSRGSGAPADGELDDAAVTAVRGADAIEIGLNTVMSGTSGIVLHLQG